ncbi:hypothetical protein NUW58_g5073 [Xylaria curta]|uniref:Uncharacterized protein n=1 Tax=Xylaria curta TaxID=42375 RepID=A0ACC1P6E0_9PEZI|nr:hypothetical protein NUW58_g5073 [Xylaria curta]
MSNPGPPNKPCLRFKRGKCNFGVRCWFSHDLIAPAGNKHAGPLTTSDWQRPSSSGRNEDELQEWKQLLRQGRHCPNRALPDRFFRLAFELIEGDLNECQEVVKLLSQEDGLNHIRLLVEQHVPGAVDDRAKQDLWAKQMQPLFALITHQRVVDSAVLEQQVAAIYNFMQGVGSRRMKIIFDFAIDLAHSASNTSQSTTIGSPAPKLAIIETCLAVLSKMIDCNTANMIDQTFKAVTQQVSAILNSLDTTSDDYLMLQSHKWLRYINCRLEVGDELPSRVPATQSIGSRAEFTLPKNLPGRLSASGRRHDNDHDNIADISILPTHDEIISTREEYLPSNDPSSFHIQGVRGRLDREFRLLREDTVGQLRDAVRNLLEMMQSRGQGQQTRRSGRQNLFTYMYEDLEPVEASFERVNGVDLLVRFPQPKRTNRQKRREWWAQSKRLHPGALVCIINQDGSVLFCVVAGTAVVTCDQKGEGSQRTGITGETSKDSIPSLAEDDNFAYVHLNLAERRDDSLQKALRWYRHVGPRLTRCLVEFPGVLLASFQHTLEALQMMSRTPDVPFPDLIAPVAPNAGVFEVGPPQYTAKANFYFDLKCIVKDGTNLTLSPTQRLDPKTLTEHSTLDETQSSALLDSLSRSLALIQGPPGTGKSYTGEKIIKVLLANKQRGNLGPILCVCYTNHALDQLLEHLLDDGVRQIIRIGSRSKSERLEDVNIRAVARSATRTKSEKNSLWESNMTLEVHERSISTSLKQLRYCLSQSALEAYLSQHHRQHHQALFGTLVDEDGFQKVQNRSHQLVGQWLRGGQASEATPPMLQVEQLKTTDLWALKQAERYQLYNYWQSQIRDPIIQDLIHSHEGYVEASSQRNRVIREVDLQCLSAADVVGVTTTGLARNLDLLRRVRCRVLLCEEAGEVLEAHNLTALLPSIEHCILIGDHLQLRPQIQNYDLSSANPRGVQYSLDVSLFERLVKPSRDESQRLPFSTLDTQRRMHPSISELIRQTLYPSLVDGGDVVNYPEVLGMKKRLFWFHHSMPEDRAQQQDPTSNSHTNSFEIEMTVALVQHLVRQGTYGPDDIAVITPYLGQLHRLRREMQTSLQISVGDKDLEELSALDASKVGQQEEPPARASDAPVQTTLLKSIRLATVDNFQGEEAKVVVISLVRSNEEKRCGFLNTPNRINVLLSRAKHGMYLIGNSDTYEHIPMWAHVITMLRDKNNIGPTLELQCPRQPDYPIEVSTPDHFLQFSPEGGCLRQCDQRLPCPSLCGEACPDSKYCQVCGVDDIKSIMVDFIMGMQYHEINLDEDPCIFPDCGHFITKSNMDGIMDLKAHYTMSAEDDSSPVALSSSSAPFSMDEVKTCPSCRGSLRNIARYGRIIRRAILDEATKKFISWSHSEFLKLADQLIGVRVELEKTKAPVPWRQQQQQIRPPLFFNSRGRLQQLYRIRDWIGSPRYTDAISLWKRISTFINRVREEEQPLQLVANHVRHATKQRKITGAFAFDESALQVKGVLQASALSLRCEIVIFTDFMTIRQPLIALRPKINLDLKKEMEDCETLIKIAKSAQYPREQAEGHIYFAQFCAFARTLTTEPPADSTPAETSTEISGKLKERGIAHIAAARELVAQYQSIVVLQSEIEAAEKMLCDAAPYTQVSAKEMRAVYQAMAREFSGTGHWYTCANGHPFTIGECGMPMQEARCPECGASVGGTNHRTAEGVRHAEEIEALARNMNQMGI